MIVESFTKQTGHLQTGYDLSLEFCGTGGRLPARHEYGPALCNAYILQYCLEGRGIMEVDGRIFALKKGDCIVTFPGQTRIERADAEDPWALIWLGLNGKSAVFFFEKMGLTPDNLMIQNLKQGNMLLHLQEVVEAADKLGMQRDFRLGSRLFTFMDECLHNKAVHEKNRHIDSSAEQYVTQAIGYMNMHYFKSDITIQAVADHIGINRSYLYEIFKKRTGVSPQEYLTQFRIKKACEYLLLPQATVTSVAYSVGYEPSVFSKAFKKAIGINPSEYIKESVR